MSRLSPDVWIDIACFISVRDLASLMRTSWALHDALQAIVLWERLLQRDAPYALLEKLRCPADLGELRERLPHQLGLALPGALRLTPTDFHYDNNNYDIDEGSDRRAAPLADLEPGATKALYRELQYEIDPGLSEIRRLRNLGWLEMRLALQLQLLIRPPLGISVFRIAYERGRFTQVLSLARPALRDDAIADLRAPSTFSTEKGAVRTQGRKQRLLRISGASRRDRRDAAAIENERRRLFAPPLAELKRLDANMATLLAYYGSVNEAVQHGVVTTVCCGVMTLYGMQGQVNVWARAWKGNPFLRLQTAYTNWLHGKFPRLKALSERGEIYTNWVLSQPYWTASLREVPVRSLLRLPTLLPLHTQPRLFALRSAFVALGALRAFAVSTPKEIAYRRFALPTTLRIMTAGLVETWGHGVLQLAVLHYFRVVKFPLHWAVLITAASTILFGCFRAVLYRRDPYRTGPKMSLVAAAVGVATYYARPTTALARVARVALVGAWPLNAPRGPIPLEDAVDDSNGTASCLAAHVIRVALSSALRTLEIAASCVHDPLSGMPSDAKSNAVPWRTIVLAVVEEVLGGVIEVSVTTAYGHPAAGLAVRSALKTMQMMLHASTCLALHCAAKNKTKKEA